MANSGWEACFSMAPLPLSSIRRQLIAFSNFLIKLALSFIFRIPISNWLSNSEGGVFDLWIRTILLLQRALCAENPLFWKMRGVIERLPKCVLFALTVIWPWLLTFTLICLKGHFVMCIPVFLFRSLCRQRLLLNRFLDVCWASDSVASNNTRV